MASEEKRKESDLPMLANISADNFLHRFYMRQSLVRYDNYLVAAACVLLGSKAEETTKNIGYVAEEYIAVRQGCGERPGVCNPEARTTSYCGQDHLDGGGRFA